MAYPVHHREFDKMMYDHRFAPSASFRIDDREITGRVLRYEVEHRPHYPFPDVQVGYVRGGFDVPQLSGPDMFLAKEVHLSFLVEEEVHVGPHGYVKENDIYIPKTDEWSIKKHLEAIKELQKPKQKELRDKARNQSINSSDMKRIILL